VLEVKPLFQLIFSLLLAVVAVLELAMRILGQVAVVLADYALV
jgi:hypothetical protein